MKPIFTVVLVKTVPPVQKSVTESCTVLEASGVFRRRRSWYMTKAIVDTGYGSKSHHLDILT